jgi:hypothetical protein
MVLVSNGEKNMPAFVVYNTKTTVLLNDRHYATMRVAKVARTRAANLGEIKASEYSITDVENFVVNVEKMVERRNAMNGESFMERVNMPFACSPSSEAYWCS